MDDAQGGMVAVGFRMAGEGGDGGGATWENETRVELRADDVEIVETQTANTEWTRRTAVKIADIGQVILTSAPGGDRPGSLKLKLRRKKWWDALTKFLADPPKVLFRADQEPAFRTLAARLMERIG
ncbi:MAG: hypothetical protein JXP34_16765 [Planctomycetes bacterium]|nr:hypothetical protein [Planctomycetota bacterium]